MFEIFFQKNPEECPPAGKKARGTETAGLLYILNSHRISDKVEIDLRQFLSERMQ